MPQRKSIPTSQKAALRARKRLYPNATQKDLREWFKDTYDHTLSSGLISDILSRKYDYLDADSLPSRDAKRQRRENWPELENALFEWIIRVEGQIPISAEIIRRKAQSFWEKIYPGQEMPTFSNGWLHNFQTRRSVRWYRQHGEEGGVLAQADQEMLEIRQVLSAYSLKDQFNCDETGLFWKQTPARSLSTRQLPGRKKDKARITALFCCNADGSEKLRPWFIGTAKNPRAFRAAGVNIQNLNLIWRSNQKAWITAAIFIDFLRWFDRQMSGRNVVLLMDNFSAHQAAVTEIQSSGYPLQNTLIIWLPANSTSRYQPLDQGIIFCWKSYWKRYWIRFILQEFELNRDPVASMNVLRAIRWGIQSWEFDLSGQVIQNCFRKALDSQPSYQEPVDPAVLDDIQKAFSLLKVSTPIQDLMDIDTFLNPAEEAVQDTPDDIDSQVLAQYGPELDDDSEGELEILPQIPLEEALEALRTLRLYEEQQAEGVPTLIYELDKHERVLWGRKLSLQTQRDIRSYFTG
jgi:hypothetical protein